MVGLPRPARVPAGGAVAALVFGAAAAAAAVALAANGTALPALPWIAAAGDRLAAAGMALVACLGVTDAVLRREGRALPVTAAATAIGVLWIAHLLVAPEASPQLPLAAFAGSGRAAAYLLQAATFAGPALLALALLPDVRGLDHPGRGGALTVAVAAGAAGGLAVALLLAAPHLPEPPDPGRSGGAARLLTALPLLPAAAGLALLGAGRRGDARLAGGIAGALVFGALVSLLGLASQARYDAFWYAAAGLRLGVPAAVLAAILGLYRRSVQEEASRLRDLALLHRFTTEISSTLELERIAARTIAAALDVLEAVGGETAGRAAFLHRRGREIVLLDQLDRGGGLPTTARRLPLGSHRLVARGLEAPGLVVEPVDERLDLEAATVQHLRGQGFVQWLGVPLAGPDGSAGLLVVNTRRWWEPDEHAVRLLESLGRIAGAAVENAANFTRMQDMQAEMRQLLDASTSAVVTADDRGVITSWNPAAEALFGWPAREALGRRLVETIVPARLRAEHERLWAGILRLGTGAGGGSVEVLTRRRDGTEMLVELSVSPPVQVHGETRILGLARDISGRRRAEAERGALLRALKDANQRLEQANSAKSHWVSLVGHEVRNALTGIQAFSDILVEAALSPEELHAFATDIGDETRRLSRLITKVLELERLETGRVKLEPRPVDLNGLVTQALDHQRRLNPRFTFRFEAATGLPEVPLDPDRVRQVLDNLIGNAVKFSPEAGEIRVRTFDTGTHAVIDVGDQGVGIPDEQLRRIWEPYVRAERPSTRGIAGTGLGLAVVKRIVELHRGQVRIRSDEGVGTTVTVNLPLGRARQVQPAAANR